MPLKRSRFGTVELFVKNMNLGFKNVWNVALPLRFAMIALCSTRCLVRSFSTTPFSKHNLHRTLSMKSSTTSIFLKGVSDFGLTTENSFLKYLNAEPTEGKQQHAPRQVYKAHLTKVLPEPVPTPYLIAASESCAKALGLAPTEFRTLKFVKAFAGNELIPGLDTPYCSNYGCHCYSSWFGQLGDGRAMALGEVLGEDGERYELQLKGCGRSPYSRGFDGRAVLRSSIREFLVSEAMFHLGKSCREDFSHVIIVECWIL
jgi:Protein adenylyltransferase SelO